MYIHTYNLVWILWALFLIWSFHCSQVDIRGLVNVSTSYFTGIVPSGREGEGPETHGIFIVTRPTLRMSGVNNLLTSCDEQTVVIWRRYEGSQPPAETTPPNPKFKGQFVSGPCCWEFWSHKQPILFIVHTYSLISKLHYLLVNQTAKLEQKWIGRFLRSLLAADAIQK